MRGATHACALFAAFALSTGCAGDEIFTWLGFPEVGVGETLVLVHGEPSARQVLVYDPEVGPMDVAIVAEDGQTDPFALTFGRRAGEVDLALGDHTVVAPQLGRLIFGPESAFFPGEPRGVFSLERRQDPAAVVWRSVVPVPSALSTVAISYQPKPCPAFGPPVWSMTVQPYENVFVEAINATHGLVVTRNVDLVDARWVASREGLTAAGDGEDVSAIVRVPSAQRPGTFELWMGDLAGELWAADPDPTVGWVNKRPLGPANLGDGIIGLASTATTSDLFAATASGRVFRYDGRRWIDLGPTMARRRQMVSVETGGAMVVTRSGRIVEATDFGLSPVPEAPSTLHSLQFVSGFGPVVGDEAGTFYAPQGDGWAEVVPERFGWFGLSAAPYDDGLMFLLASGTGGYFSASTRLCIDTFGLRVISTGEVLTLGRDLLIVGGVASADEVDVLWVPAVE